MNFFLQLYALRRLMQGSEQTPKAPLGNNARPLQQLHHRTIRTNIDFNKVSNWMCKSIVTTPSPSTLQNQQQKCPSMYRDMYYKANKWTPELLTIGRNRRDYETVFDSYKNPN
jgi:hypothetical protein